MLAGSSRQRQQGTASEGQLGYCFSVVTSNVELELWVKLVSQDVKTKPGTGSGKNDGQAT